MSEGGYIQGAGDDSEGWAHGLTPPVFWANQDVLKRTAEEDLPDLIADLIAEHQQQRTGQEATLISPTKNLFLNPTDPGVNGSGKYDLVIDCNGAPNAVGENPKRLNLGCALAKLGSRDLRKSLNKVRDFVNTQLGSDPSQSLLVTCDTGKDLSAGALLAIICQFYNENGMFLDSGGQVESARCETLLGIKKRKTNQTHNHRGVRCLTEQAQYQQAVHPAAFSLDRLIQPQRQPLSVDIAVCQRLPDGASRLLIPEAVSLSCGRLCRRSHEFCRTRIARASLVDNGLDDGTVSSLIERIQSPHILLADVKVEDVGIRGNALLSISLGQRYPPLLQGISDQHLLGSLIIFLGDFDQGRVVCFVVAHDGRVCLDNNSVLFAVGVDLALLAPRVQLETKRVSTKNRKELVASLNIA